MSKKNPVNVNVSVNAIIQKGDRFLLVQQAMPLEVRGKWSLPGGKVENGETFEDAVLREVSEETGLKVRKVKYLGCKHGYPQETVKHFFFVDTKLGNLTIPEGELLDIRWFTLEEVRLMKEQLRKPWVLAALEEWIYRPLAK